MSVRVRDWKGESVYLGPSKAIVIDNKDPSNKGRIRIKSPIFGESSFIHYVYPDDGFFSPPDVGSVVYITQDGGDPDFLIAWATINDGDPNNPDTREEFRRSVPTNRGWASPGDLSADGSPSIINNGHLIELDDGIAIASSDGTITHTKESKGLRFSTSGGHVLRMLEELTEGSQKNRIELITFGGQSLQLIDDLDASGQQIIVKDSDNRTLEVLKSSNKIRLRDSGNSKYIDLDFSGNKIETESPTIKIGKNAIEPIILGNQWVTYNNTQIVLTLNALISAVNTLIGDFNSHTHSYSPGSDPTTQTGSPSGSGSSPPSPAGFAGAPQLSIKGKIE